MSKVRFVACLLLLLVTGSAFAQVTDPTTALMAEISTLRVVIAGILIVLAGVVGLFVLWRYIKRIGTGDASHTQAEYDEFYSRMGFRASGDKRR